MPSPVILRLGIGEMIGHVADMKLHHGHPCGPGSSPAGVVSRNKQNTGTLFAETLSRIHAAISPCESIVHLANIRLILGAWRDFNVPERIV